MATSCGFESHRPHHWLVVRRIHSDNRPRPQHLLQSFSILQSGWAACFVYAVAGCRILGKYFKDRIASGHSEQITLPLLGNAERYAQCVEYTLV